VKKQTLLTIENIKKLISVDSFINNGISSNCTTPKIEYIRGYVKHASDIQKVREVISEQCPDIPILLVNSDICREELLVEIEGIASLEIYRE